MGILNGIDYDHWNPERDVHLPGPFSASNLEGYTAATWGRARVVRDPMSDATMTPAIVDMSAHIVGTLRWALDIYKVGVAGVAFRRRA